MKQIKIKVDYLIEEEDLEDFIKATKKYVTNLSFKKNKTLNNIIKSKSVQNKEEIILSNLKKMLVEPKTTMEIYKTLKKQFTHNSYKNVSRFLSEQAIKGIIQVKKKTAKKGGYKNYWYLSEVL
jgi:hypothetical protein